MSKPLARWLVFLPLALLLSAAAGADSSTPETTDDWKVVIATSDRDGSSEAVDYAKSASVNLEETTIAGVRAYRVTPAKVAPEHVNHLFVFIHGGSFNFGHGLAGTHEAISIAANLGIPVLSIDYRMAPDDPAPAAMDDIVAVWRALLAERPARTMALGGTSAGGNLTLVATLRMKDLGLELPAALFVGTPAADLGKRGDSRSFNQGIDKNLAAWPTKDIARYVRDKSYEDPYISPVFGDFTGFPPTYLISGTRDLLLSDTVRTHRKLRQANVEAELNVYEGQSHGDYAYLLGTPDSAEHFRELGAFLVRHLGN